MTVATLVPSLIRTYVPLAVGALVAWLLTLGVELNAEAETGLIVGLTALVSAVYYTIVRLLEKRWPALSVLLGSNQMPAVYAPSGSDGVKVITTLPEASVARAAPGAPGTTTGLF